MWPFRKKKIFQIIWAYHTPSKYYFTEIVRAVDITKAWKKLCNKHCIANSLIEWKEVK